MNEIIANDKEIIASVVLNGDISKLSPEDQVKYYNLFCESLGLNPVTQPFDIIILNGRKRLYAKKDATEQLRKLNGVSIIEMQKQSVNDLYIVTVKAQDKTGRQDISTGAVNIKGLIGDALANAIMKSETKAKRRVTLSICGLGILDETEIETIPNVPEKTENQIKFETLYQRFEELQSLITMDNNDKQACGKVEMAKDVNKLPIKQLQDFVDYIEKKYANVLNPSKSKIIMEE